MAEERTSKHLRTMTIVTVVLALLGVAGMFETLGFKRGILPAALIVFVLLIRFRHARKKLAQAAHNPFARSRDEDDEEED